MGNTALKAIIGADATPFVSAMKTVEAISTKAGTQTAMSLRQAEKALLAASASTELTVRQTNFYAQALAGVRNQLAQITAAEAAAAAAANASAEARAMAARKNPGMFAPGVSGDMVTRTTNNAGRIAALKAEIAEKKRLQALDAERAAMVSGDLVTRTTNNSGVIARLRAEYDEKKRLKALDAERAAMVTGSEVIGQRKDLVLASLRARWNAGERSKELRAEIKHVAALRAANLGGGPASIGRAFGGASSAMFISVARDSMASLASGANPLTVLMQQGPQVAQAFTMMGGKAGAIVNRLVNYLKNIPWAFVGAWTLAIGSVVAAFVIFRSRVNSLVKDMVGPLREAFNVDHIARYLQKAGMIAELQKDINDEVRKTKEAHDSVIAAMDRQLALTKDRIDFEKQLLEIQKDNELAAAKTPAEREAIEKKYSNLILAKKKEERDAELQNMKDMAAKLPAEIQKNRDELKRAMGGGFMSKPQEEALAREAREKSAVYDDYRRQLKPGEKDTREFSLEQDRATLAGLAEKEKMSGKQIGTSNGMPIYAPRFSEEDQQARINAQDRIAAAQQTKQAEDQFANAGGDRERARARVAELEAKIKEDEKKLAELGTGAKGQIADKMKENLQKDKHDLELEQARLARTANPGGSGAPRELTANQRIGAYIGGTDIALLDVTKAMDRKLGQIVKNTGGPGGGHMEKVGGLRTK